MSKSQLRVVIAEDDNQSRAYLRDLLSKVENVEVIGDAANGRELIKTVQELEPDVLFVDIEMPEVDGFNAVNSILDEGYNPYIIFLTGHDEFALEAFDLCAIDYIVKPVRLPRILKSFDKIRSFHKKQEQQFAEIKNILTSRDKIFIKTGSEITFIEVDSIIMLERESTKTIIYCKDTKFVTPDSLNSLEEKLCFPEFFRSHKSYIVNLKYISQLKSLGNRSYEILFQQAPFSALISRSKVDSIFSLLNIHN